MVNPFAEVNWRPGLAERKKFALSLVIGFPCLALAMLLAGRIFKGQWDANLALSAWLAAAGLAAGGLFYFLPQIARPFYVLWYFLACCLGVVAGNFLLAGFFYLVVTPFGLAKRALGKRAFDKGFNRQAATYWREARSDRDPASYFKQF